MVRGISAVDERKHLMFSSACDHMSSLCVQGVAGSDGLPGENGEPVSNACHMWLNV